MSPLLLTLQVGSTAAGQDTTAALPRAPFEGVDSVIVESPLPGGIATVVRWFLNAVPWWFQAAGAVLAVLVGLFLLGLAWKRRGAIRGWLATRQRPVKWALAGALFVFLAGAAGVGTAGWDYMQHDNGFCTGCHVMNPSFQEFVAHEDKHDTLQCHDCHQQSIFASMRQLYLWVAERPTEIGEHSRLPNAVCERCHVTGEPEKWQRIASTAGHRVHLESDSTALQDVLCVTCHAQEVHRFVPVRATCGQSGCHEESQTDIVLGTMAGQTSVHCTTCHQFTAEVPALATTDSARGTLVPGSRQCLSCHEMRAVLADFDPASEPHGGTCGTCHNPHAQSEPGEAVKSCASAQCHADWRQIPFHVGPAHRGTGTQCLTCHVAHQARQDASDCEGCHRGVRAVSGRRPPVPFDTSAALRPPQPLAVLPDPGLEEPRRGKGDTPPESEAPGGVIRASFVSLPAQARDTFPHTRHRRFSCLECHTTSGGHGRLTFEQPRGCMICHHQPRQTSPCTACHQAEEFPASSPRVVRITVQEHAPRAREIAFSHRTHAERRCAECHTTPISMTVAGPPADCRGCHEEHHQPARDCTLCHRNGDLQRAHQPPAAARPIAPAAGVHRTCANCHPAQAVQQLTPNRSYCATCHTAQRRDHYEPRECAPCHFLTSPDSLRSRSLPRPPP